MMKRMLPGTPLFAALALLAGAAPAVAQTATPPATQPSPAMLDSASRGIRPVAPARAANMVRPVSAGQVTQPEHDYMARLAGQLREAIDASDGQLQSANPAVQRTARYIVATRQRELDAVNKWLAAHPG